jgi:chemotaxis protein CheD
MRHVLPASLAHILPRRDCVVRIGPGEYHVSRDPGEAIITTLGSCVSVALCDPVAQIGGLNHFMLPESGHGNWGKAAAPMRYGNFAMERLVNDILRLGGRRDRLRAKLFGGARLRMDAASVGARNLHFVEEYLRTEGMAVVARATGGARARRLCYLPVSGRAFLHELPAADDEVARQEARLRRGISQQPVAGGIELFD